MLISGRMRERKELLPSRPPPPPSENEFALPPSARGGRIRPEPGWFRPDGGLDPSGRIWRLEGLLGSLEASSAPPARLRTPARAAETWCEG